MSHIKSIHEELRRGGQKGGEVGEGKLEVNTRFTEAQRTSDTLYINSDAADGVRDGVGEGFLGELGGVLHGQLAFISSVSR
jgi:hypothetical protein